MFDLACVRTRYSDRGRSGRQISEAEQVNPGEKAHIYMYMCCLPEDYNLHRGPESSSYTSRISH